MPNPTNCDIQVQVNPVGLTQDNVTTNVILSDSLRDGDDRPSNSSTFHTKVNGSSGITWNPVSLDPSITINITDIRVTSDTDVFQPDPSAPNGLWTARVKPNPSQSPILSEYTIYFQLNNQGTIYHLDPKMEVNPNT
jgi:hypothetical protein